MRKKDLQSQNEALYENLGELRLENEKLKVEIENKDEEIKKLNSEIENYKSKINSTAPLREIETKIKTTKAVTENVEYGSVIIGKIVVEAAKFCNELSVSTSENTKDLLNLILGKTEVAKSEILKIITSNNTDDDKKTMIDNVYSSTIDYFVDVKGQTI